MGRGFCVLLLLLFVVGSPSDLSGQVIGDRDDERTFELEQNYPNPFNPETRIPFRLSEDAFAGSAPPKVTMRVYNVLLQYVASPTAVNHPAGEEAPVTDLEYQVPGRHEAHWDGRDRTGAFVASGVYILELTVNGVSQIIKMFVSK